MTDKKPIELMRELYPELSEEELKEARENIRGYLSVVLRIHNRLEREQKLSDLTREETDDGMETERSKKY